MWKPTISNFRDGTEHMRSRFYEMKQKSTWTSTMATISFLFVVIFIILLILDYTTDIGIGLVKKNSSSPTFNSINVENKGVFKDIHASASGIFKDINVSSNGVFDSINAKGSSSFKTLYSDGITSKSINADAINADSINANTIQGSKDIVQFGKPIQIGHPKKKSKGKSSIYTPLSVDGKVSILGPLDVESIQAKTIRNYDNNDTLTISAKTVNIKDMLMADVAGIKKLHTNELNSGKLVSSGVTINGDTVAITGESIDSINYDKGNKYRALKKDKNRLLLNVEGDYVDGIQVQGSSLDVLDGQVHAKQGKFMDGLGPYMIQLGKGETTQCMDASLFSAIDKGVNACDPTSQDQRWYYNPIKKRIYNPNKNQCIRAGSAAWAIDKCRDSDLEQVLNFTVNDLIYNRETETCFDMSKETRHTPCCSTEEGTDTQRAILIDPIIPSE